MISASRMSHVNVNMDESIQSTQPLTQTQPVDDTGFNDCMSQSQSQSPQEILYWGRLYPLSTTLTACDLVKNIITVGKVNSGCDIIIKCEELPKGAYVMLSNIQFTIRRKQVKFKRALTTQIELVDNSTNGTFINREKVRKSAKVLKTNDIIGLPISSHGCFEAYVFIDSLDRMARTIPHQVRQNYDISRQLGFGAFGEVVLVFHKGKCKPYALKTVHKDVLINELKSDRSQEKLLNELEILQSVEHPNVIKMIDFIDCKKEKFLFLEFMGGKDLEKRIQEKQRLNENLAKLYFYQIASGVNYLHSCGITHRDLKPANILLASSADETLLKLSDFGLSKIMSSTTVMKTMCGTKMFVAPEVLSGGAYSQQVDIWSMGVLLYVCLSGIEPFSKEPHLIERHIKSALYTFMPIESWRNISTFAKLLIDQMLIVDPQERLSITNILHDTWLQDQKMIQKVNDLYNSNDSFSSNNLSNTSSPQKKRKRL